MKNIEKIVAIGGLPGLYSMESSKSNGIIVTDFEKGQKQFITMRKHQFSPLQSIAIYTYEDSIPLLDVFNIMENLNPEPNYSEILKSNNKEIFSFFRTIIPDFNEERVFVSDIKKVIKWFEILKKNHFTGLDGLIDDDKSEEE